MAYQLGNFNCKCQKQNTNRFNNITEKFKFMALCIIGPQMLKGGTASFSLLSVSSPPLYIPNNLGLYFHVVFWIVSNISTSCCRSIFCKFSKLSAKRISISQYLQQKSWLSFSLSLLVQRVFIFWFNYFGPCGCSFY